MVLDLDFDVTVDRLQPANFSLDRYFALQQFLYFEARLLDERRWSEWLALWTPEGMYWIPHSHKQASPFDHISLAWENHMLREVRARRVENPRNWSQLPPTQTARVLGNITVEGWDTAGFLVVRCVFQLSEWRKKHRQLAGSYLFKLKEDGASWRIQMKKVNLINCDAVHENIEIFI
jgi:ethylbenzene dioxygenase subunit beta